MQCPAWKQAWQRPRCLLNERVFALGNTRYYGNFVLSGKGAVVFTGAYELMVDGQMTGQPPFDTAIYSYGYPYPDYGYTETLAKAYTAISARYTDETGSHNSPFLWNACIAVDGIRGCDSGGPSNTYSYTLTNSFSTSDLSAFISFSAYAETRSTAPVPEPGAWALFGAGLLVIRVYARRRHA